MQTLRRARFLARFVLVWFALALGAALASPLVKPQAMELVCSSAGSVKLVQLGSDDDAARAAAAPTLDCPLCLLGHLALPTEEASAAGIEPAALPCPGPSAAMPPSRCAAAPPARGPPVLS